MKKLRFDARGQRKCHAFTLTELLAIIVMIALLLLCFRGSALARAAGQTKRAQCASNLRQFTLAMHIFAQENDDRMPSSGVTGVWAWDMPSAVGSFVESTGCKWTVMYCPGTAPRFSEADNRSLYNYTIPFRVIGYAHTFPTSPTVISTNINPTLTPPTLPGGFSQPPTPVASERVLLADATISNSGQGDPAARYSYNYVSIVGGYPVPHLSPHLDGRLPSGGNLGMLDGHVEWRKFADMTPRTQGGSPVFWW